MGKIPSHKDFGAHNMAHSTDNDDYSEFVKWYETVKNDEWDFKKEFHKYCEADVELLSKAVLEFRKLCRGLVDVDPWRYTTLASLCMDIYRCRYMPENSIVGNSGCDRQVSRVSKEGLLHTGNNEFIPECPITVNLKKLQMTDDEIHQDKIKPEGEKIKKIL